MCIRDRAKCVAGRVARLKANKFGQAKGSQDDSNVTIVAHNEERVTMEVAESEDATQQAAKASMNEFARKQMWRKLQQKYGMEEEGKMPPGAEGDIAAAMGGAASGDARVSRNTFTREDFRRKNHQSFFAGEKKRVPSSPSPRRPLFLTSPRARPCAP